MPGGRERHHRRERPGHPRERRRPQLGHGGTRVLSDWLVVRISANPGRILPRPHDRLVEGAKRQKTPNEIALNILLAALTIIFLLATATLLPFSIYAVNGAGQGQPITVTVLVALLVCLIPTTIGGCCPPSASPGWIA